MIRGLVYLTGLATLGVLALVVAVAIRVDRWPWRDYAESGRQYVVQKLEDAAFHDDRSTASREPAPVDPPAAASPAPAPAPAPTPALTPLVIRHTVVRGDTLYDIAGRYYGASEKWMLIARANGIRRPADLKVGRVLLIPAAGTARADEAAGRRHAEDFSPRLALTPAIEARDDGEAQR